MDPVPTPPPPQFPPLLLDSNICISPLWMRQFSSIVIRDWLTPPIKLTRQALTVLYPSFCTTCSCRWDDSCRSSRCPLISCEWRTAARYMQMLAYPSLAQCHYAVGDLQPPAPLGLSSWGGYSSHECGFQPSSAPGLGRRDNPPWASYMYFGQVALLPCFHSKSMQDIPTCTYPFNSFVELNLIMSPTETANDRV